MAYLLSVFTGLRYLVRHHDDDWIDVLHNQVTANVLITLSILVSFKQFGGRPIECMLPDTMHEEWEQYVENYCWAQDTYYLSYEQDLTRDGDLRTAHIGYYQWISCYLILSALSFPVPGIVWRFLSSSAGIRLESLIEQAVDPKNANIQCRQEATRTIAIYLENALRFHRRLYKRNMVPHKVLRFLNLPYKSYFLTGSYILAKLLYLSNVVAQFMLMNYFLESGSRGWYGWDTLRKALNGTQWTVSGYFPRDTLCDFQVRVPGQVQQYSIQCVLSINLLIEKIFVFLWFWYHILATITILSLLYWMTICLPPFLPHWFVQRRLELADMPFDPVDSEQLVKRFVGKYLQTDGVFILHMINMHTSAIFSSDLVAALYKGYCDMEILVRSVSEPCGKGKWPSMETLHRMRSEIAGGGGARMGLETKHPPPSSAPALVQPIPSAPVAPPAAPPRTNQEEEEELNERRERRFMAGQRDRNDQGEDTGRESAYNRAADRRRQAMLGRRQQFLGYK